MINSRTIVLVSAVLSCISLRTTVVAQEISVPDPGLNTAIRDALQKPAGPLTSQDLLGLAVLNASGRNITNLQGLEFAHNLTSLNLRSNHFTNLSFPGGLAKLNSLDLGFNPLTNLTLPPDVTNLDAIFLNTNVLTTFVLPETLAAQSLAGTAAALRAQGIPVFTYPLEIRLTKLQRPMGAFRFGITGPPGFYAVLSSTNLTSWSALNIANNPLGGVFFNDASTLLPPRKFYRAQLLQTPPPNMVFVPGNTFLLGSPTNEVGHQSDESPQTLVTLSHGFWISKFLVTQADYVAVTGSNPSQFPGDSSRPVESVSWFAASNYCALLTQQDLAAARIPAGSHYRLPTEAEWECAARAGTSTRFYYGDDPGLAGLTNYAWYSVNSGFTTHPVGQKLPNAWGLFDTAGNVWEWCQDWYGPYSGGAVTDPRGAASNSNGWKVIRGAAWEAFDLDCRSARRSIEPASPFISDFIIGFRVVLAIEP